MSEKRLQKRDEISDEYKWKLEDMYETDELWEAECEKASQLAEKLSGFKGHLADSAATLLDFFKKQDELSYYLQKPLESTILVLHRRIYSACSTTRISNSRISLMLREIKSVSRTAIS